MFGLIFFLSYAARLLETFSFSEEEEPTGTETFATLGETLDATDAELVSEEQVEGEPTFASEEETNATEPTLPCQETTNTVEPPQPGQETTNTVEPPQPGQETTNAAEPPIPLTQDPSVLPTATPRPTPIPTPTPVVREPINASDEGNVTLGNIDSALSEVSNTTMVTQPITGQGSITVEIPEDTTGSDYYFVQPSGDINELEMSVSSTTTVGVSASTSTNADQPHQLNLIISSNSTDTQLNLRLDNGDTAFGTPTYGTINVNVPQENVSQHISIKQVNLTSQETLNLLTNAQSLTLRRANLQYESAINGDSTNTSKIVVQTIYVDQDSSVSASHLTVTSNITISQSSSLNLTNVDLSSSEIHLHFDEINNTQPHLIVNDDVTASSVPARILLVDRTATAAAKMLADELYIVHFVNPNNCNSWQSAVDLTGTSFQSTTCVAGDLIATTAALQPTAPEDPGLSGGAIAGIVIACVVVVAIIIAVSVYFAKTKNRSLGVTSSVNTDEDSIAI